MFRLKILRVLLPASLLLFALMIFYALRDRPPVHRRSTETEDTARQAEGIHLIDLSEDRATLEFQAGLVKEKADGGLELENVERLLIAREDESPLIVRSEVGQIDGVPGQRVMRLERDVVITDPENGLVLTLPGLDVDEAAGEARSSGDVRFEGKGSRGHASSMIYGLHGQPTVLAEPVLEDLAGGRLTSRTAVLLDGLDDVEWREDIRGTRGEERFVAGLLRLVRRPDESIERVHARESVVGTFDDGEGAMIDLHCESLEVTWDDAGKVERAEILGNAQIHRSGESVAAESIIARREGSPEEPWRIQADESVHLQSKIEGQSVWLRSESLRARLTAELELSFAEVRGRVRFDGPETTAEAARATFSPGKTAGAAGEIRLYADGEGKARLARQQTRIAAEQIVTDPRGWHLIAERRVEASLLPRKQGGDTEGDALGGLFRMEEAVHFVAARLEGREAGSQLTFSGNVRGWQGGQNLSAAWITIDQRGNTLTARDKVTTRIPRMRERPALGEADYIQVAADTLEYDGNAQQAVYEGSVRVRLVEGWLEAARVEVDLGESGEGMDEMRAFGDVHIEFRNASESEQAQLITGSSDRMTYVPDEETIWLYGDQTPASVRRIGENGGTTKGRVLRYRLDKGTFDVDSGEQGPARINTEG